MTSILALDASTDACSVALLYGGEQIARFELASKSHTQRLLPMVDEVLTQAGLPLSQLDAIAFGCGPGSFTGLRICLGVVQGLAFGADLPVIPVSTLQAMAQGYYTRFPDQQEQPVLAALDARMQEVYAAVFCWQNNLAHPLMDEAVMSPEQAVEQAVAQMHSLSVDTLVGCGSGWTYPALQTLAPASLMADWYPAADAMLPLAVQALSQGSVQDILQVQPVYLRNEVSWQKRQRLREQPL